MYLGIDFYPERDIQYIAVSVYRISGRSHVSKPKIQPDNIINLKTAP